jgi:GDP-L-fucose synthase
MNVLVTGGRGFVGQNLQKIKPNWVYVSSEDYNLLNFDETIDLIKYVSPDAIVHLAGRVGGIQANNKYPAKFFYENVSINTNVVQAAVGRGVKRLIASLSTCAFPDTLPNYPFKEYSIHDGPPAETNLSYGYSKRMLMVHCNAVRKQYGYDYSTFTPSNLYGPYDNFSQSTGHFVGSMIRRVAKAKNGDTLELYGTGKPLRQELFVEDLVKIIPILLEKHHTESPIIIAPNENLSIREMAEIIIKISGKELMIKWSEQLDGQYRKDGSNWKLFNLIGDFDFTPFEVGIKKTYEWYLENI